MIGGNHTINFNKVTTVSYFFLILDRSLQKNNSFPKLFLDILLQNMRDTTTAV